MRKILISTCAILMISVTANACSGITIKGNSGTSYCLSKQTMNWYSAYAWCEAQGMELIDLDSVCKNYNSCPELNLSFDQKTHITDNGGRVAWIWINKSISSDRAFNVNLGSGALNQGSGYRNYSDYNIGYYALCF